MDTFPFVNNLFIQKREQYEVHFQKGCFWGEALDYISKALDIYSIRCNISLKGIGNTTYRAYTCSQKDCTFNLRFNKSN